MMAKPKTGSKLANMEMREDKMDKKGGPKSSAERKLEQQIKKKGGRY